MQALGTVAFISHTQKSSVAYVPSYAFEGPLLTDTHAAIHEQVDSVPGWLEPEDSMKLYELGYLAPGPFLEIGTYCGKSTTVLTSALRDAGREVEFYSLDIDREVLESARSTLSARGLGRRVSLVHGSTTALFRTFPTFRPRFVFLDGNHSAKGLARDLAVLGAHVPEGGLLLFHDYLDPRNEDPADADYGIPQAIRESWVARDCEFAGIFGCMALYRRLRGPRGEPGNADASALMELIRLDRPRLRFLVEVARPGKRFLMRAFARIRGPGR